VTQINRGSLEALPVGFLCWLPSPQDCAPGLQRKLDRHKVPFRKQVVFPGFVNYAQHSMLARYTVG